MSRALGVVLVGVLSLCAACGDGSGDDAAAPHSPAAASTSSGATASRLSAATHSAGPITTLRQLGDVVGCGPLHLSKENSALPGVRDADCTIRGTAVTLTDWSYLSRRDVRDYLQHAHAELGGASVLTGQYGVGGANVSLIEDLAGTKLADYDPELISP